MSRESTTRVLIFYHAACKLSKLKSNILPKLKTADSSFTALRLHLLNQNQVKGNVINSYVTIPSTCSNLHSKMSVLQKIRSKTENGTSGKVAVR